MNFQDRLAALKERIEGSIPKEYLTIMHQATADLAASGIQDKVLKVDETMPAFTLPDQDDQMVKSTDLLQEGPLVITFYRGVWCPYCNLDLANLKSVYPAIRELGADMIAISPELPEHSRSIISKSKLPFSILSDRGNEVAALFGLRFTLSKPLKKLYRDAFDIDLVRYSGDASWTLPMPARFMVDTRGIIRYGESSPDYTRRPDPDDLLAVLRGIDSKSNT